MSDFHSEFTFCSRKDDGPSDEKGGHSNTTTMVGGYPQLVALIMDIVAIGINSDMSMIHVDHMIFSKKCILILSLGIKFVMK